MSADSFDALPYEPDERTPDADARRHYWAVAIGLQAVDGLEVSPYLRKLAADYEEGRCSLQETGALIRAYHSDADSPEGEQVEACEQSATCGHLATRERIADRNFLCADDKAATAEADLVSQRIAELLEAGSFMLAPEMLPLIHRTLFQDLDAEIYRPGQFKTERLVKQEDILNGDSVLYADPLMIQPSLDYLFREEARATYGTVFTRADIERFAKFIALLWQVHPFVEGNTRTIAVFSELYLVSLGFPASNSPFQKHARYYRDALVRANYRNNEAGIAPTRAPLEAFYENLIQGASHTLNRETLLCPKLFDNPHLLKNIPPARALTTSQGQ